MGFWADLAGVGVGLATSFLATPAAGIAAGEATAQGLSSLGAAKTASGQQTQAAQQAAAMQTPYTNLGTAAAGELGALLGLPVSPAAGGPYGTATMGTAVPRAPVATASSGMWSGGGTVRLMDDSGAVRDVPQDQALMYLHQGARPVGAQ